MEPHMVANAVKDPPEKRPTRGAAEFAGKHITLLVTDNPKRGASRFRFEEMMKAVAKGRDAVWILHNTSYTVPDIRYDIAKKFIEVK